VGDFNHPYPNRSLGNIADHQAGETQRTGSILRPNPVRNTGPPRWVNPKCFQEPSSAVFEYTTPPISPMSDTYSDILGGSISFHSPSGPGVFASLSGPWSPDIPDRLYTSTSIGTSCGGTADPSGIYPSQVSSDIEGSSGLNHNARSTSEQVTKSCPLPEGALRYDQILQDNDLDLVTTPDWIEQKESHLTGDDGSSGIASLWSSAVDKLSSYVQKRKMPWRKLV